MRKLIYFVLLSLIIASCASKKNSVEPQNDTKPLADSGMSNRQPISITVSACPVDMIQIDGNYCGLLEEICLVWLDKPLCEKMENNKCTRWSEPMRCGEFRKPTVCKSPSRIHMNFCIDKYEYPNKLGEKPQLRTTWYQAKSACEAQNKRLCIDKEWTQACRGNDNLPYPYGYTRDATACRIDLPWQDPATHTFEQLDKTVPAGSMPKCVSPYGVYDMTGNADEWTVSSGGTPYVSVFKGGHPHGVRNRCSPRTEGHGPTFSYYDTGFRCCKDIK